MFKRKYVLIMALCILLAACGPQATPGEAANVQADTAIPQEAANTQVDPATPQEEASTPQSETSSSGVSYSSEIQPIFDNDCGGCHGGSGGLSLGNYDQLMAGGNGGALVVAGSPDDSILVKRLTGEISPKMPRGGSLSDEQINLIRQWIEEGALNN
jgi:mono/diheme cytochrome c family protein